VKIPAGFDFNHVSGLTKEVLEKLNEHRPATLGEAKNVPGITPAAISNLSVYLEITRQRKRKKEDVPRGTSVVNE
jgi:tRNA uridine 5-carboxymethylaminomethyl modification enzyme